MKGGNPSCNTWYLASSPSLIGFSRQRRVKCDGVRPVCARCLKSNRQCLGFEEPNRLILKDETDTVIKRFRKRSKKSNSEDVTGTDYLESSNSTTSNAAELENLDTNDCPETNRTNGIQYADKDDSTEWYAVAKLRMTPHYERNQVALFCCRETINLRTLSWVMSDDKWIELLPEMMDRSETLTSVIHANAANYVAKLAGARASRRQALTHYSYALGQLQRDLYDPIRQRSDETLFAIILLGLFDVSKPTKAR